MNYLLRMMKENQAKENLLKEVKICLRFTMKEQPFMIDSKASLMSKLDLKFIIHLQK